jgi:hypothetical protein
MLNWVLRLTRVAAQFLVNISAIGAIMNGPVEEVGHIPRKSAIGVIKRSVPILKNGMNVVAAGQRSLIL